MYDLLLERYGSKLLKNNSFFKLVNFVGRFKESFLYGRTVSYNDFKFK